MVGGFVYLVVQAQLYFSIFDSKVFCQRFVISSFVSMGKG